MDSRLRWTDFHFLNTAFRDAFNAFDTGGKGVIWIQPSLVRLSGRRSASNMVRSVRVLDALHIEYDAPFPLPYILGPRTLAVYSTIFILLLQLRRAKDVLDRILVRNDLGQVIARDDVKIVYAMRSKLAWVVRFVRQR
jgi:gamma-tubulin complex component 5